MALIGAPSRTVRRVAGLATVPVALLGAGALVLQGSNAAYSGTTSNPSNSWATGSVTLTDDDGGTSPSTGTAMFTATGLVPGSTGSKCIQVTSNSTVPTTLKLYGTAVTATNNLDASLKLKIEQGTGATFASCSGFTPAATNPTVLDGTLAAFKATATDFGSGLGPVVLAAGTGVTRSYRFTYTVDPSAPNSTQGSSAAATFVWEAQTT